MQLACSVTSWSAVTAKPKRHRTVHGRRWLLMRRHDTGGGGTCHGEEGQPSSVHADAHDDTRSSIPASLLASRTSHHRPHRHDPWLRIAHERRWYFRTWLLMRRHGTGGGSTCREGERQLLSPHAKAHSDTRSSWPAPLLASRCRHRRQHAAVHVIGLHTSVTVACAPGC